MFDAKQIRAEARRLILLLSLYAASAVLLMGISLLGLMQR
jgi:hypothetical protein